MNWGYKQDKIFSKPLWGIIGICRFLLGMSWLFAHYRNGSFPYQFPAEPRLTFKNWSYWECIKHEWKGRHYD